MKLVISVTVLWLAGSALLIADAAAKPKPLLFKHKVTISMKAAATAWPDSPCKGQASVRYDPALVNTFYPDSRDVAAVAMMDGSCRIVVGKLGARSSLNLMCRMITHELGHLAGFDHITEQEARGLRAGDPRRTMDAYGAVGWSGCDRARVPAGFVDPYKWFK